MERALIADRPRLLPLPRPLMASEVLDAGFRLFRAGLLRTLPYSGLAVLVLELPTLYSTFLAGGPGTRAARGFGRSAEFLDPARLFSERHLVFLAAVLIGIALVGVITLRLSAVSRGVKPRFRTELATVLRRAPTATIATIGAFGIPVLAWAFTVAFNSVLSEIAVLVAAAPLMWAGSLFIAAVPAFWCDRLGPLAALARSVKLSRRRSWSVVGTYLAATAIVMSFYVVAAVLFGMLSPMLGRTDLVLFASVSALLSLIVGAFGVPLIVAVLIVVYEDLKLRDAERRGAPP